MNNKEDPSQQVPAFLQKPASQKQSPVAEQTPAPQQAAVPEQAAEKPNMPPSILGLDEYRLAHPKEIGSVLKQLMMGKEFLLIAPNENQNNLIVSCILDVNVTDEYFLYDLAGRDEQNQKLLKTLKNVFSASQNGAAIQFVCGTPVPDHFEGKPALRSAFPQALYRRQRRQFFRMAAPVANPYTCTIKLPDRGQVVFEIADLSVTGIGLRSKEVWLADIPIGLRLSNAMLDFRDHGQLVLDMEVASMRNKRPTGEVPIYHVGCRLLNLPGAKEAQLQRVITSLEFSREKFT